LKSNRQETGAANASSSPESFAGTLPAMKTRNFLILLSDSRFMKFTLYYSFFLLAIAILSCNPVSRMARGKEMVNDHRDTIQSVLIFPAFSNIDIVEKRNAGIANEALSQKAENEIHEQLAGFLSSSMDLQFMDKDALIKESASSAGMQLIKSLRKSFNPKTAKVPEYLMQVLDAHDQDYGLLILHVGFTRTPANMVKEYLRHENLTAARLGIYITRPYSSYSAMYGFLIDKKKKRVIRYKELLWPNKEPDDKYIILTQVRDIILTSFRLGN
jgi:hypothetical protein